MKTLRLIVLGALLSDLLIASATAQIYSPKRLTRPIAPHLAPTNSPARPTNAAPAQANAAAPATAIRPRPTQAVVRIIQPPPDPEKVRAAREEALRKTVAFQKKRAEEGSESAQYELGLRYLKGEGVERDESTGRHWLTLSSQSGYGPATRKLEELDRPPSPPPQETKP